MVTVPLVSTGQGSVAGTEVSAFYRNLSGRLLEYGLILEAGRRQEGRVRMLHHLRRRIVGA